MTGPDPRQDIRVEEGVLVFEPCGPVGEADVRALIERGDEIAQRAGSNGGYWVLVNVQHMGAVDPKARRLAATNPGVKRFRGGAIYGASLVTRALITLIVRGMAILGHTHVDLRFFDSAGEAWAWIRGQQKQGSSPNPGH